MHAPWALLPGGWQRDVVVDVAADGTIASVAAGQPRNGAADAGGAAGAGDAQRAFARVPARRRRTHRPRRRERRGQFWTWRQAMYDFLDRLDPDGMEAIAAQVYVEMAKAGYAPVAEFHYVHHDPAGQPLRGRRRTVEARGRGGASGGTRTDAVARFLRARRLQRRAAVAGAATLHDTHR